MIGHECYRLAPFLLIFTGYRRSLESYAMAIRAMTVSMACSPENRLPDVSRPCWPGPQLACGQHNFVSLCLWPHRVHAILVHVTKVQPLQETQSSDITTARQPKKHLPS